MNNMLTATDYKIKIICSCFLLSLILIMGRLFYLQIYLHNNLINRAHKNFYRTEKISSRRGNIFDCKGNLLATNRPVTMIYWQGMEHGAKDDYLATLAQLEQILKKPIINTDLHKAIKTAQKRGKKVLLHCDTTFEQLSKIKELFSTNPHIIVTTDFKRYYPHQTLASHIIGYINTFDEKAHGKMGLEKMFEDTLKGEHGTLIKTINSMGTSLLEKQTKQALAGQDIITTLDLSLQRIAEDAFPHDQAGCLIIMDPKTGALRTLVSRPTFDPDIFLNRISLDTWNSLQEKKPFLNRALSACYPPASIFKLITLSAALEHHIIDSDMTFFCCGFVEFKGRKYYCNRKLGHGNLSIAEVIAQSCNIPFFEIAKTISIDTLADYAQRFGLGIKTNINFPELQGLVPSTLWKLQTLSEDWWPGETLSAAIGQSYLLATPLQIARMIASIFTGYLVNPRIVEDEPITQIPLQIKDETRKFLKKAMKLGVIHGTSKGVSNINDFKIYAKTGTAQVISLSKQQSNEHYREHAWFVAHVQYQDETPLTIVMLVEHVGSSKEATKIAKKLLVNYRTFMRKSKIYT